MHVNQKAYYVGLVKGHHGYLATNSLSLPILTLAQSQIGLNLAEF